MMSFEGEFCGDATRQTAKLTLMYVHPDCTSSVWICAPEECDAEEPPATIQEIENSSAKVIFGLDIAFALVALAMQQKKV